MRLLGCLPSGSRPSTATGGSGTGHLEPPTSPPVVEPEGTVAKRNPKSVPAPALAEVSSALLDDLRPLNPRHRRFVLFYLGDSNGNASDAYRRVYGGDRRSVESAASRLLSHVKVSAVIAKHQRKAEQTFALTVARLEEELARVAFFDPGKLFKSDGAPLAIHEIDEDTRRAIAGFDVEELWEGAGEERVRLGDVRKWRLADKIAAIRLGMQRRGALVEKVEVSGPKVVHLNIGSRRMAKPKE